jgi:hypothetical protein
MFLALSCAAAQDADSYAKSLGFLPVFRFSVKWSGSALR